MTAQDRVFLNSLLECLQPQVPFQVQGNLEDGEITLDNFPALSKEEMWVLQGLLESAYRFCKNNASIKGIRFRDCQGNLFTEVHFA